MMEATPKELQLIDELRKNLSDLCLEKHYLENKNLLRFLRARGHSVQNAENMFRGQIEWREENDIDSICEWQPPKEYKSHWPWQLTGFDNMDGPVIVLPIGLWDASKVGANYNDFVKYCFHGIESVWRLMQFKSQGHKTMKQFSIIVDLKNLSFRTVTTIDAMQGVMEAVKAFEANYPETLRVGLLINAPYVFEIAWRLIKPFVSQETHSKLRFLGSDSRNWKEELLKVMDADQFPKKYGGDLPDSKEIKIENGCAIEEKGNSNDYICENLMRVTI